MAAKSIYQSPRSVLPVCGARTETWGFGVFNPGGFLGMVFKPMKNSQVEKKGWKNSGFPNDGGIYVGSPGVFIQLIPPETMSKIIAVHVFGRTWADGEKCYRSYFGAPGPEMAKKNQWVALG